MDIKGALKLITAILVSLSAGAIGSYFTAPAIPEWYEGLMKPALNPPSWVFAPVWTILYVMMGVSAFLVWKRGWNRRDVKKSMMVFGLQLVLNSVWSILFFGLRDPGLAMIGIILLWFSIVWTMILFKKVSKASFYLLIPYIAWVSFASYLNYSIWVLN